MGGRGGNTRASALARERVALAAKGQGLPPGTTVIPDEITIPLASRELTRRAYEKVAKSPGAWVDIADIRAYFSNLGLARAQQDKILRAVEQFPDVNIVPESNQKALSQRTRDAAVIIGDQKKHFIAFGV